jgi:acyl CoA:acetate/3-ketoacid CoA transferase alpha subunit
MASTFLRRSTRVSQLLAGAVLACALLAGGVGLSATAAHPGVGAAVSHRDAGYAPTTPVKPGQVDWNSATTGSVPNPTPQQD